MKNKIFRTLIVFIIILTLNLNIYALTTDEIIGGADKFLDEGEQSILNEKVVKGVSDTIFNIFWVIGIGIVVIVGAVLGIKFMVGSVEEKAEIKESIKPYVLGAIVIFGAITIWLISVKVVQEIF